MQYHCTPPISITLSSLDLRVSHPAHIHTRTHTHAVQRCIRAHSPMKRKHARTCIPTLIFIMYISQWKWGRNYRWGPGSRTALVVQSETRKGHGSTVPVKGCSHGPIRIVRTMDSAGIGRGTMRVVTALDRDCYDDDWPIWQWMYHVCSLYSNLPYFGNYGRHYNHHGWPADLPNHVVPLPWESTTVIYPRLCPVRKLIIENMTFYQAPCQKLLPDIAQS